MTDALPKPVILLDGPALAPLKGMLSAQYEVLTIWDQPDRAAFLAGPGQTVRVILGGGETLETAVVEALPNLGLIARIGSGYEAVDVPHARARGVQVTNTPGVNADDVADHAVALLLAVSRGVLEGDRLVRSGGWTRAHRGAPRPSMKGFRVGIVGLGDIGLAAAKRLEPFGSEVRWWGPRAKPDIGFARVDSLMELASWAEALVICARADASNEKLIDAAVLDALGAHGVIVNISRGSIMDEVALIERLRSGGIAGAGLDVFEDEPTPLHRWADVPNVILNPHIAGNTRGAIPAMVGLALENVRAFLAGEPLPTPVP
jgi:lactate dehydrogenase-like 2-hydroxyacid dehydrogenase